MTDQELENAIDQIINALEATKDIFSQHEKNIIEIVKVISVLEKRVKSLEKYI